jgi:hypothetical protein
MSSVEMFYISRINLIKDELGLIFLYSQEIYEF